MSEGFAVIPNWLLRDPKVGHHAKMLWAYLSSRAGRAGVSWPSQELIAEETGMSRATVQRALTELRELGLVTVEVETHPGGRRNRYLLHAHQGGSHHTEAMGRITGRREEEPVEEEPAGHSSPTSYGGDTAAGERQGVMTTSWRPTPSTKRSIQETCPDINYVRECHAFMDWHIGKGDGRVATQSSWDALFRNWCARKQTEWERDHPHGGVEADPVTGMPVNPRPAFPADSPR